MTGPATSVAYDGDPAETITIKCVECGSELECVRVDVYSDLLGAEGWQIERGEHGEIVATCGGCRERDYHDGGGEHDA